MVSPDFRIRVSETLVALVKGARPPLGGRAQVLPAVVVRRQREDCWTLDPSTVSQGTSMGGRGRWEHVVSLDFRIRVSETLVALVEGTGLPSGGQRGGPRSCWASW